MSKSIRSNQAGVAHLGLVLVIVVFFAVGSLVYWRFSSSNKSEEADISQVESASAEEELQSELEGGVDELDTDSSEVSDEDQQTGEEISNE